MLQQLTQVNIKFRQRKNIIFHSNGVTVQGETSSQGPSNDTNAFTVTKVGSKFIIQKGGNNQPQLLKLTRGIYTFDKSSATEFNLYTGSNVIGTTNSNIITVKIS